MHGQGRERHYSQQWKLPAHSWVLSCNSARLFLCPQRSQWESETTVNTQLCKTCGVLFCCCGDVPFWTAQGKVCATCLSKAILLMHAAKEKQARKTNKAIRTTELTAQPGEQLSMQEKRHFIPCYFLTVTGLLLIKHIQFQAECDFQVDSVLKQNFSGSHCYSWHSSLLSPWLSKALTCAWF